VTVTVLAIADQISPLLYDYFQRDRWRDVDLVLSCGDLPPEYLDFLCTNLGAPLVYVRGNHDGAYASSQFDGMMNAHGRIVTRGGVSIAGFEGCRRYNLAECQMTEKQMRRIVTKVRLRARLRGIPRVVLSHAPPENIHDGPDPCHRGFTCFRRLIDVWQPDYFLHGHTHGYEHCEAVTKVGNTHIINVFPYRVIEIPSTPKLQPFLPQDGTGSRERTRVRRRA
jgi:uncharacterized protein